ncbi:expressed unknown protein [Seminavis robusta]|uniref:Uncharacterized protein n=1 Tax=Seminavis robusta TaxID=568900 RepID=A0A9N8EMA3_9STRA|nr:expressed unknown protein [Seminavis robusta]|eukprot:Sro1167_g248390.1 n/a (528) ;mRNA; f:15278-16861
MTIASDKQQDSLVATARPECELPAAHRPGRRGPRKALKAARLLMARRKLGAIIRDETPQQEPSMSHPLSNDLELNPPRYLHLLRQNPVLARDRFRRTVGLWGDEFSIYPLVFTIEIGASLEIIREVFEMNPEALSQPVSPLEGDYPLHLACSQLSKSSVPVVIFLAQAYADAVKMPDLDDFLPLHRLLRRPQRCVTLHEVHTLLDIFPQSMKVECVFGLPLLLALNCEQTKRDVLHCLIARFPKDVTDLQLGERVVTPLNNDNARRQRGELISRRRMYGSMTLEHARLISKIFPQIRTLCCTPQQWSERAFVHFMVELYHQNELLELDLHLPPNLLSRDDFACSTIQQLLRQNKSLQRLAIDFGAPDHAFSSTPDLSGTERCLHYLGMGLCQNQTLRSCHVAKNLITSFEAQVFTKALWKPLTKVLVEQNATLECICIPHVEKEAELPLEGQRVQFWTRLNRFGRAKARNPRVTLNDFVDVVIAAVTTNRNADGDCSCYGELTKLQLQNVLFGLLQECPSRWSYCHL